MKVFLVMCPGGNIRIVAEMATYGELMYSFRNGDEIVAMFTVSQIYGWKVTGEEVR